MGWIEWEGIHESGRGHVDMNILFEFGTAATIGSRIIMLTGYGR